MKRALGALLGAIAISQAVIGVGCAGTAALREHVAHHSRLDPLPGPTRSIEPAMKDPPLLNPLECLRGPSGDPLSAGLFFIGCVGVCAVVDIVALPIQLPIRHGQSSDLEAIGASCRLEDPVRQVTDRIALRMANEVGFSLDSGNADAQVGAGVVVLGVNTEKFTRSGRVGWTGKVFLREPHGKLLWQTDCDVETPARDVNSILADCPAARQEVEALADGCAAAVVRDLKRVLLTSEPAALPGETEGGRGPH